MILSETDIPGVLVVETEQHRDQRGWFGRTYCSDEFRAHGVDLTIVQCSSSFNERRGTLRGMHFQADPAQEPKLVRCTRGAVFDVVVDLRPTSPTYCAWVGVELDPDRANGHFVPTGCAHGFLTLVDATELSYAIGTRYAPELTRGVRWDDPAFGIEWPSPPAVISDRDASYPDFQR